MSELDLSVMRVQTMGRGEPGEHSVSISLADRQHRLELLIEEALMLVGEDPYREGLVETPARVAKAWVQDYFSGYWEDPQKMLKSFEEVGTQAQDLVIVRDIPFSSHCEHHMAPFLGTVNIAYIPGARILGLSKFSRLVEIFAHRLQVQERLTAQVADTLMGVELNPIGVMCVVKAEHTCMSCRGARALGSTTVTSAVRGIFISDSDLRHEALNLFTS